MIRRVVELVTGSARRSRRLRVRSSDIPAWVRLSVRGRLCYTRGRETPCIWRFAHCVDASMISAAAG